MLPRNMGKRSTHSPLALVITLLAVIDTCLASKSNATVHLCHTNALMPPFKTMEVSLDPNKPCNAENRGKVVSVKVFKSCIAKPDACRFYSLPGCRGRFFDADHNTVDTSEEVPENYPDVTGWGMQGIASVSCQSMDPLLLDPPPPVWDGPDTKRALCPRLEDVTFHMRLHDADFSGTWDTISFGFGVPGQSARVVPFTGVELAERPYRGTRFRKVVDLRAMFGVDTIALDQIAAVQLYSSKTANTGADQWRIQDLQLRGRCAGTGIPVVVHKYSPIDLRVQIDRDKQKHIPSIGYRVWDGAVDHNDWTPRIRCGAFHSLDVTLHMATRDGSGTWSSLYITVKGRKNFRFYRWIADKPYAGGKYSGNVPMSNLPAADLREIEISVELPYDPAKIEKISISAICSYTGSKQALEQYVGKEVGRNQNITVKIDHSKWKIS